MLTLGVTDGITCGAAVIADGRVLAAINEERLCRKKMAYGFPRASIAEALRIAGVTPRDVDVVLCDTVNNFFRDGVAEFDGWLQQDRGWVRNAVFSLAGNLSFLAGWVPGVQSLYYLSRAPIFRNRRRRIGEVLAREFRLHAPLRFVDHHLAHATSAYFTSGFDDATVVSMDGGGDGMSSRIYVVRDGRFKQIGATTAFHSLANYYAYVTHICGFKAQKHEGKITGLAAHGTPRYRDLLDAMIRFDRGVLRNASGRVFHSAIRAIEQQLPAGWEMADLAASVQQHCEALATEYIRHHLRGDAPRDVALAGGLFANVRINQCVHELDEVDRVFVHPGMTDMGLAVGAALTPCMKGKPGESMVWPREVISDVYYGPGYTARRIESAIQDSGLAYQKAESIEVEVARLLAEGHVVARFDGRLEYGPRALGNRSILYQPADPSVNDWLNESLHRTEFMPFAPATLMEHAPTCYRNYEGAQESARFMTITFDCTDWMKQHCPGVVHVDGTARPQLVRREDNPSYYKIIDEFRKLTGLPTVINTSFNMHEEPIVCTPADALRSFQQGHLDYLAIGDFLVPAPAPIERPRHALGRAGAVTCPAKGGGA